MSEIAKQVEDLLVAIEQAQEQLAGVYRDKRLAIRKADAAAMDRLTRHEQELVARLRSHLQRRSQILQCSSALKPGCDSLQSLWAVFPEVDRERLRPLFERNRRLADANRRESWVVWIVSQQSIRLLGELVEMIANGGRRAPIYSQVVASYAGGALLDASA